jgi:hypothetical protein
MNRIDITTSRLAAAVLGGAAVAWAIAGCAAPTGAASAAPAIASSASTSPSRVPSAVPSASTSPFAERAASTVSSATALASASASPSPSPAQPSLSAEPVLADTAGQPPHFATPDAAMRYLVAAYNAHDLRSEMHVTTPDARTQLETERQWVNTFSFNNCQVDGTQGDYICQFDMASMVATASPGTGTAAGNTSSATATAMGEITVLVAPADRPGWYMYGNMGCGG